MAGLSDVGSFERQYFKHNNDFPRYFVVDDEVTGRHLWAETATNQFVQVSQHLGAEAPVVTSVTADSVQFVAAGRSYEARQRQDDFVRPSTPFPSEADSILQVVYLAVPRIKLEIKNEDGNDVLKMRLSDGGAAPERWRITPPDESVFESTAAEFVLSTVVAGEYTVEMIRGNRTEEQIRFTVRNVP